MPLISAIKVTIASLLCAWSMPSRWSQYPYFALDRCDQGDHSIHTLPVIQFFANGSSRSWPFFLKLRPYIFFFGGSMLYKQWVGLREARHRCLSHCSIKSAEYGVCDVSCHLRALLNTALTLRRSSAESLPASAGNAYWNLATTRAINAWVSPLTLVPVWAADLKILALVQYTNCILIMHLHRKCRG